MFKFIKLLLISLLFFLLVKPSFAQISGEQIKSFDSNISINKDGAIDVRETIFYDFANLSKHGIYRTIPYTKVDKNGKTYALSFLNFSVNDENGKSYKFQKTTSDSTITLKIGDPNRTITGPHTYVISYNVRGALGYFSDHEELFWNATGTDWNIPIAKTTTVVSLPEVIKQKNLQSTCFTGSYGSKESNCTISQNGNITSFSANNSFNPHEGMSIVVGFPKGIVATLLPQEKIPFFDTLLGKITLVLIIIGIFLWYIVLPILLIFLWYKYGRDPYVGKAVRAWYDPPKTKTGRALTPAETGGLVDETVDNRDIFATIIDLARRGYLTINEKKKNDFTLIKQRAFANDKNLQTHEADLLSAIFNDSESVKIKDKNLYQDIVKIKANLYKTMVSEGFFRHNPQTIRTCFYILSVIGLFTGNFILFFISLIFGRIMPRKTLFGAQQATVGKGLKNFLSSQERQLKFQADKQMFFEKFLPYAIAFGVEKIWAKRFEKFDLKPPDWYQGYPGSTFNSIVFANSLNSSYSSFSSASHPPASTGSGFGGGGFSGGGGGGGGGGSW